MPDSTTRVLNIDALPTASMLQFLLEGGIIKDASWSGRLTWDLMLGSLFNALTGRIPEELLYMDSFLLSTDRRYYGQFLNFMLNLQTIDLKRWISKHSF